jgi:hypothetical protein
LRGPRQDYRLIQEAVTAKVAPPTFTVSTRFRTTRPFEGFVKSTGLADTECNAWPSRRRLTGDGFKDELGTAGTVEEKLFPAISAP